MSRCWYLDMFLTIWLKKGRSSSIRIILHTKMSPKRISKHEDLPTCFDRFVQFLLGNKKGSEKHRQCLHFDWSIHCSICYLLSLQNKEKPEKKKKTTRKTTRTELQRQCITTVLTIGSMGTGKYLLNIYPIQNQTLHGSENLFYHRQILQNRYGLHSWINTCGKNPPV